MGVQTKTKGYFLKAGQMYEISLDISSTCYRQYANTILPMNKYIPTNYNFLTNSQFSFKPKMPGFYYLLMKDYTIKMNIIRHHLLPNFTELKFCNQKSNYINI